MRVASQQTVGWTVEQLVALYAQVCAAGTAGALPQDAAGARLRHWWQVRRYRHMSVRDRAVWRREVARRYTIALVTVDLYQRRRAVRSLRGARKQLARWACVLDALVDEVSGWCCPLPMR